MKISRTLFSFLLFAAMAWAGPVTGTVTNKTSNQPAAGVDIVVSKMAVGLPEIARAKTDASGHFTVNIPDDDRMPHLIRAEYQGSNYPHFTPPGTQSVSIDIYDVAKKVDGITGTADVMAFQTLSKSELEVTETYVVRNDSKPPRTQLSEKTFELYLPEGAQLENAAAGRAGGMPVNTAPVPQAEPGKYAFIYPLRPGETLFRMVYKLPYTGKIALAPRLTMAMDDVVVMVPKTMQFEAKSSGFAAAPDENGMHVAVMKAAQPGDRIAFEVSGEGEMPKPDASDTPAAPADSAGNLTTSAPGGGLGNPINTPTALDKYKWWIFGAVILALIAGAGYILGRPEPVAPLAAPAAAGDHKARLLEALKEEMFRLESDHAAGAISEAEYAKTKSAMDVVLKRALGSRAIPAAV